MDASSIVAIVLAVVAIGIAIWQGATSQQQLTLARKTNGETEQNLADIRRVTEENRKIAEDLKTTFESKIGRIFDQYVEGLQRKADAEHRDQETGAEMASRFMNWVGKEISKSVEEADIDKEQGEDTDGEPVAE